MGLTEYIKLMPEKFDEFPKNRNKKEKVIGDFSRKGVCSVMKIKGSTQDETVCSSMALRKYVVKIQIK